MDKILNLLAGEGMGRRGQVPTGMGYIITILERRAAGKWNKQKRCWRRESGLVLGREKDEANEGEEKRQQRKRIEED